MLSKDNAGIGNVVVGIAVFDVVVLVVRLNSVAIFAYRSIYEG
jgi:hypothetical protein